jgi:predicted amidophosphoribosyltransferase
MHCSCSLHDEPCVVQITDATHPVLFKCERQNVNTTTAIMRALRTVGVKIHPMCLRLIKTQNAQRYASGNMNEVATKNRFLPHHVAVVFIQTELECVVVGFVLPSTPFCRLERTRLPEFVFVPVHEPLRLCHTQWINGETPSHDAPLFFWPLHDNIVGKATHLTIFARCERCSATLESFNSWCSDCSEIYTKQLSYFPENKDPDVLRCTGALQSLYLALVRLNNTETAFNVAHALCRQPFFAVNGNVSEFCSTVTVDKLPVPNDVALRMVHWLRSGMLRFTSQMVVTAGAACAAAWIAALSSVFEDFDYVGAVNNCYPWQTAMYHNQGNWSAWSAAMTGVARWVQSYKILEANVGVTLARTLWMAVERATTPVYMGNKQLHQSNGKQVSLASMIVKSHTPPVPDIEEAVSLHSPECIRRLAHLGSACGHQGRFAMYNYLKKLPATTEQIESFWGKRFYEKGENFQRWSTTTTKDYEAYSCVKMMKLHLCPYAPTEQQATTAISRCREHLQELTGRPEANFRNAIDFHNVARRLVVKQKQ